MFGGIEIDVVTGPSGGGLRLSESCLGDGERFVSDGMKVGVARVDGQDDRASVAGVFEPVQQVVWWGGGRGDEHGLAARGVVESAEVDGEVWCGAGGDVVADQRGCKEGLAAQAGGVVEVGGEVPGFVIGCADDQQPTWGVSSAA